MSLTERVSPPLMNRNLFIACSVVAFHVAALWALQSGLLSRAVEVFVPVQIFSEFVQSPSAVISPPIPTPEVPAAQPVQQKPAPLPAPAQLPIPQPQTVAEAVTAPMPTPAQPANPVEPPPTAMGSDTAPLTAIPILSAQTTAVAPLQPAAPKVELPSSDADYLRNPRPPIPRLSKINNEQGTVLVNVLIGIDGTAKKANIKKSSGYFRLDDTALKSVLKWTYIPGKRDGKPEEMWFVVPMTFALIN